jgi:Villin headpiece domain
MATPPMATPPSHSAVASPADTPVFFDAVDHSVDHPLLEGADSGSPAVFLTPQASLSVSEPDTAAASLERPQSPVTGGDAAQPANDGADAVEQYFTPETTPQRLRASRSEQSCAGLSDDDELSAHAEELASTLVPLAVEETASPAATSNGAADDVVGGGEVGERETDGVAEEEGEEEVEAAVHSVLEATVAILVVEHDGEDDTAEVEAAASAPDTEDIEPPIVAVVEELASAEADVVVPNEPPVQTALDEEQQAIEQQGPPSPPTPPVPPSLPPAHQASPLPTRSAPAAPPQSASRQQQALQQSFILDEAGRPVDVKTLGQLCSTRLKALIHPANVATILEACALVNMPDVRAAVIDFLTRSFRNVVANTEGGAERLQKAVNEERIWQLLLADEVAAERARNISRVSGTILEKARPAATDDVARIGEDGKHTYPLSCLISSVAWPSDVDAGQRELSLHDDEFVGLFKVDKAAFGKLPAWKKTQLRKQHDLF